eukprot:m.10120 g.10120  ORF g.10120 m.10120 type:complete len:85 (-) comp8134_c0_seq1:911-1165(-)
MSWTHTRHKTHNQQSEVHISGAVVDCGTSTLPVSVGLISFCTEAMGVWVSVFGAEAATFVCAVSTSGSLTAINSMHARYRLLTS